MFCNMCCDDDVPTTDVVETVNGFGMVLTLCDKCLVKYAKKNTLQLDRAIHGLSILDYNQLSVYHRKVIVDVLASVGLTLGNWQDWRDKYKSA